MNSETIFYDFESLLEAAQATIAEHGGWYDDSFIDDRKYFEDDPEETAMGVLANELAHMFPFDEDDGGAPPGYDGTVYSIYEDAPVSDPVDTYEPSCIYDETDEEDIDFATNYCTSYIETFSDPSDSEPDGSFDPYGDDDYHTAADAFAAHYYGEEYSGDESADSYY